MLNGATYAEEGAFWPTTEAVFDVNLSSKAIKFRNCEMHAHIDFGFEIGGHELGNYKIVFKAIQSQDATYQASNSDATVKDNASVYGRVTSNGTKMGSNKKINTMNPGSAEVQWTTYEYKLSDFYDDGESIDGINIWINRKCTTGFIYVDDFRLIQSTNYPRYCTPARVMVTGITHTEYNVGDTFEFDGTISVLFSDGYVTTVPTDDSHVTITSPDMSTSGTPCLWRATWPTTASSPSSSSWRTPGSRCSPTTRRRRAAPWRSSCSTATTTSPTGRRRTSPTLRNAPAR